MASAGGGGVQWGTSDDSNSQTCQLYCQDLCALKSDPSKIGLVEKSWHDREDSYGISSLAGMHLDPSVPPEEYIKFTRSEIPPRPCVFIVFANPAHGCALIPESKLTLLDRCLTFGDLVKRKPTDAMSGTVTRVWTELYLRPSFPGVLSENRLPTAAPVERRSPSLPSRISSPNPTTPGPTGFLRNDAFSTFFARPPHIADEGKTTAEIGEHVLEGIPAEELIYAHDYDENDYVLYENWLGRVNDFTEEITIRLENGSVVVVEDPFALEIPLLPWEPSAVTNPSESYSHEYVANTNSTYSPSHPRRKTVATARVYTGQYVVTTKGNVRRGIWKYGAYDPTVSPQGYVVDVRTASLEVTWIGGRPTMGSYRPPLNLLDFDILESGKVRKYHQGRLPSSASGTELPGSVGVADGQCGDRVRFKDLDAAVLKYDGSTRTADGRPQGKVTKVPRTLSQGYDVNTFVVIGTRTMATVQWQDLTETKEVCTSVVPYQYIDEHDVWPGEIVIAADDASRQFFARELVESPPSGADPVFRPNKIGVIQSVSSRERMAKIRWFVGSRVDLLSRIYGSGLAPGSSFGTLSEATEEVSLYDVISHPALSLKRGDFVMILLGTQPIRQSPNVHRPEENAYSPGGFVRRFIPTEAGLMRTLDMMGQNPVPNTAGPLANEPEPAGYREILARGPSFPGIEEDPVDWFGQVVNVGLDGLVTVRLGALDQVRDISVLIERLCVVEEALDDEEMGDNSGSGDDSEDDDSLSDDSDEEMEETIEYEGGQRWDSEGGDEAWTTDEEAEEVSDPPMGNTTDIAGPKLAAPHPPQPQNDAHSQASDQEMTDIELSSLEPNTDVESSFTSIPGPELNPFNGNRLASFEVLDLPPPSDHAFIGKPIDMMLGMARRIRKEHKLLESSLPEGIFVRTWESRLDLLRVLIVGPTNTPYELAPFVIDFQFGSTFPSSPPLAHFFSWTGNFGRINPNLYENGKICLSLLGTWPGDSKNEGWSSSRSSMLQVLVSLLGLVLVKEPYYNEAGFEMLYESQEARVQSALYSEKSFIQTRGFITHALTHPVKGLENVVRSLYTARQNGGLGLLENVIQKCKDIISQTESCSSAVEVDGLATSGSSNVDGIDRMTAGGMILLRRKLTELEAIRDSLDSFVVPSNFDN